MRKVEAGDVAETVARLFEHSCHYLPEDMLAALPCHIASLPVTVNIQCWCARHKEVVP